MNARRPLACVVGLHHWSPWHDHGPCVFAVDRHLVRCCLRCPKIQSRFVPREE